MPAYLNGPTQAGWTSVLDILKVTGAPPHGTRLPNGNLLLQLTFTWDAALTYWPSKEGPAAAGKAGILFGVGPYQPGAFYNCFKAHGAV